MACSTNPVFPGSVARANLMIFAPGFRYTVTWRVLPLAVASSVIVLASASTDLTVPTPPAMTPERLARGKQLYADAECLACHGDRGRGDGPSAPTLKDNRELAIAATDLTQPQRFKNGDRPQDVYRTLMTGLSGTPMPSYADSLEPDQAWDLAYFVLSLSVSHGRQARTADR